MDYDQVLEHVGQFGLWQKLVIFMASLAAMAEAFMTLQVKYKSQCLKITQKSLILLTLRAKRAHAFLRARSF